VSAKAKEGDWFMNMATFARREVLYYETENSDDDGLQYWQQTYDYYMDAFARFLQEIDPKNPDFNQCYMEALEYVNESDRWLPDV